jgi:Na+/proline symporter
MNIQSIIVALIILFAVVYIGKLTWQKAKSFSPKGKSCETGCGKCQD